MKTTKIQNNTSGIGNDLVCIGYFDIDGLLTNYYAEPEATEPVKQKWGQRLRFDDPSDLLTSKEVAHGAVIEHTQYTAITSVMRAKSLQDDLLICLMENGGLNSQRTLSNLPQQRALLRPKSCSL